MRLSASLGTISLLALAISTADAATITGTVKGPDGQPFRGAFVQARNAKTKITVNVLSDNQGRYRPRTWPRATTACRSGRRAIRPTRSTPWRSRRIRTPPRTLR